MKKILKSMRKKPKTMINIRVSEDDRKTIEKKSKKYTNGNITALLINAIKCFNPGEDELVDLK